MLYGDNVKERAQRAKDKEAQLGASIHIDEYNQIPKRHEFISDIKFIDKKDMDAMKDGGITLDHRSGTYIQKDTSLLHTSILESGLEIMSIKDALRKYEWLTEYMWNAVKVDADKYTARSELDLHNGYFIRAEKGTKAIYPLQACLFISENNIIQNVHNIIIVEEDAELHIITSCSVGAHVKSGLHIGVTEFYIKKNAKLSFTMIHNWAEHVKVRPRSAGIVEEGGMFLSNFICFKPVSDIQMYPTINLVGQNAVGRLNSVIVAQKNSHLDIGSRINLSAEGCKGEIVSRAISKGGDIIARGDMIGNAKNIKAHLECRGLLLEDGGYIHAIPELIAKLPDLTMSHEAAVGKIAQDQIEYLMARGLSEDEATAAIVRGFIDVDIKGLPDELNNEIKKLIDIEGDKFL